MNPPSNSEFFGLLDISFIHLNKFNKDKGNPTNASHSTHLDSSEWTVGNMTLA